MASEKNDQQEPQSENKSAREMRVDAAHSLRRKEALRREEAVRAPSQSVVAGAGERELAYEEDSAENSAMAQILQAGASPEVLARQATDLSDHLQTRLEEVDRRDARLNSQEAEFFGSKSEKPNSTSVNRS